MMDWVAQLLGLDPSFHNKSNKGGGIIMASPSSTQLHPVLICLGLTPCFF